MRPTRLPQLVLIASALAVCPSIGWAQNQARPYEITPDARLPVLSDDNMRLVTPRPHVSITEETRSRRPSRTAEAEPVAANPTSGTFRRAPGLQADPDEDREYGRLIVVTGFGDVEVLIEGEPYPRESMQGVLLWAGYQYEVVMQTAGASSSSSSGATGSSDSGSARTVTIRLRPGETRVLMANLGEGGPPVARTAPTSSSRRDRRRGRDQSEDEEDDEAIGYLGVSSTPRGTVYIDGENTGQTTPARRIELEPGRHEVRIFYDSEERFSETKNVLIRAGVNTNVFFRLRRDDPDDDED